MTGEIITTIVGLTAEAQTMTITGSRVSVPTVKRWLRRPDAAFVGTNDVGYRWSRVSSWGPYVVSRMAARHVAPQYAARMRWGLTDPGSGAVY